MLTDASVPATPAVAFAPSDTQVLPYTSALAAALQRCALYLASALVHHLSVPPELLLLLLPFVLGALHTSWPYVRRRAVVWLSLLRTHTTATARDRVVVRDITAVTTDSYHSDGLPSDRNAVLQNAIFMYLCKVVWPAHPVPARVWRNTTAVLLLVDPFRFRETENHMSPFNVDHDDGGDGDMCGYTCGGASYAYTDGDGVEGGDKDDDDDDDDHYVDTSRMDIAVESLARSSRQLNRLLLVKLPGKGAWVPTNVDGIELAYTRRRRRLHNALVRERTLRLRARGEAAALRLERFALDCLSYFIRQLPVLLRSGGRPRYYLELQPPPSYAVGGGGGGGGVWPIAASSSRDDAAMPTCCADECNVDDKEGVVNDNEQQQEAEEAEQATVAMTGGATTTATTQPPSTVHATTAAAAAATAAAAAGAAAAAAAASDAAHMAKAPAQQHVRFRRYPLSDERSFDTLFFADKARVLRLVDDFVLRRGRFAVEGFPYKLGLLLYGPPRCGKTSVVKALATYTRRHLVAIPLHLVETNEQLYDIFLRPYYVCVGEHEPVHLPLKDVLFLLEDTDATSPLVRARVRERIVRMRPPTRLTAAEATTTTSGTSAAAAGEAWTEKMVVLDDGSGDGASATTAAAADAAALAGYRSLRHLYDAPDRLDLSGLLNVLDGVVDTPGRMVVFTTTHPERLDPALVRPGRMSTRLRMSYVTLDDLAAMLGLHFGDVPAPHVDELRALAQLEQSLHCTGAAAAPAQPQQQQQQQQQPVHDEAAARQSEVACCDAALAVVRGGGHDVTAPAATADGDRNGASTSVLGSRPCTTLPLCMVKARMTHRTLSAAQRAQVRACVAAVEAEAAAAAAAAAATRQRRRARRRFNFHITPAEVEVLCTHSDSLDELLQRLQCVMRGDGDAAEMRN